jgi:hypothetical protein
MHSKLGTINAQDLFKGLIVAVLSAPLAVLYQSFLADKLEINWKIILCSALSGGLACILRNLGTGEKGKLLTDYERR